MNISLAFVAVITCFMALYMMNRFIRRPGVGSILLLLIQLLAASIIVFSLLENVLTTIQVELAFIAAGVLLPAPVLIYDHIAFSRKRKKAGVNLEFIEKKEKKHHQKWNVSFFTDHPELWKETIPAADVYRSLSVQDKQVSDNIRKQLYLAHRFINMDKYEAAAGQYRFLSDILDESPLIAYNAGYLQCFTGNYREAFKMLKKAYELQNHGNPKANQSENHGKQPDNQVQELELMIAFNLGYALYHLGKFEQAIRYFQKVIETKPDLTIAYKNIARAFLAISMDDRAIEYLEKGRLDLRDSQMRIVLGSIYYRKGDTKKALEVLDEAVQADTKQIEALSWRGKAAIKEEMYDKAIECFTSLIQMDPLDPFHYYHLALAQRSAGEKENALKTYEKGISEAPTNSMLLYHAGTLLDEMGLREKAVAHLYKSIQGNELLEDAVNYLGVLLGQLQRYREAVQVFDKGILAFPKSYQLYFNRGIVLEMARRLEDSAESFEKAYAMNQKDPVLIYYYTAVLIKLRQYTRAIRLCKAGLSNFPDDAELIYGLSKVYAHMGEMDAAVDLLKQVLEMDPLYLGRMKKDLDLKTLSKHPGYQSLMVS